MTSPDAAGTDTCYIYGLLRCQDIAADVRALGDLPGVATGALPRVVATDAVSALISDHNGDEILQTRRNMMAHTRILEAAMDHGPILPMRFGSTAEDEDALIGFLDTNAAAILDALDSLDNCAEFGLRISFDETDCITALVRDFPDLKSEHERLAQRGADAHFERIALGRKISDLLAARRAEAQASLLKSLLPHCRNHVLKAPESDCEVLRAEFLVAHQATDAFLETAEAAANALSMTPDTPPTIRCVGPVPAYHFTDLQWDRADASPAGGIQPGRA